MGKPSAEQERANREFMEDTDRMRAEEKAKRLLASMEEGRPEILGRGKLIKLAKLKTGRLRFYNKVGPNYESINGAPVDELLKTIDAWYRLYTKQVSDS